MSVSRGAESNLRLRLEARGKADGGPRPSPPQKGEGITRTTMMTDYSRAKQIKCRRIDGICEIVSKDGGARSGKVCSVVLRIVGDGEL